MRIRIKQEGKYKDCEGEAYEAPSKQGIIVKLDDVRAPLYFPAGSYIIISK